MTDNEIIQGLNCCLLPTSDCKNCPAYVRGDGDCFDKVKQGALDIIKRQKATIEKLESEIERLESRPTYLRVENYDNFG